MASPQSLAPLYWGLIVSTMLVALIVVAIFWLSARNQNNNAWVDHTLALRGELRDVLALVQSAESAQRGYLLTGHGEYLAPFAAAALKLPAAMKGVNQLVVDNPVQAQTFAKAQRLIAEKIKEVHATIDAMKSGGVAAALPIINSDEGLRLMDAIRVSVAQMEAEDDRELAIRRKSAADSAALLQWILGITFLLICGVGVLVGFVTRHSFLELEAANEEITATNRRLRAEVDRRETAESQLRQSQKMEAIGQLTGGIAHDFNNMLGVITGSLDLMRRAVKKGNFNIERFIDSASRAAERSAALTNRLLAFGRQQPLAPEPVDANKMIANMSDLLRSTLGEHIRIETASMDGLWTTNVDPHQLESAILNIAINARDAMPEGGKLTIETNNAYFDETYCRQNAEVEAGQYAMIAITDTGCGMAKETAAKVFDPFFTTKPPGKGTGLGLSQVYGFIKQSRGHIKIYSELGNGTTVRIYLRRLLQEAPQLKTALPPRVPTGASDEIILVVEDDPLMRQMSTDSLRDLGYTVIESDNAGAALTMLASTAGVNLLFTDVVMPDVSGKKLADEALRRCPAIKILFTTGYTHNAVVHGGVLDPDVNFISKPFTLEQLAAKVRAVLDA